MAIFLNYDEAARLYERHLGRPITTKGIAAVVARHNLGKKKFGRCFGVDRGKLVRYLIARKDGLVLTRPKSTYKRRGPKKTGRKRSYYKKIPKSQQKKRGRPRDPNSRRSLRKRRETKRELQERAERRRIAQEWGI